VGTTIVHRVFLEGASLSNVLPLTAPLAAIAAASFTAAAWAFRHRLA
jgi:hypothetical protein